MNLPDLNAVDAWAAGGGWIPPGRHLVTIDEAKEAMSSNGYPQIEVTLRVTEGDAVGCTSRDWITVTGASLGRVKQFLQAVNYTIPAGGFSLNVGALRGRQAIVLVQNETGQDGKQRPRVKAYEAATFDAAQPVGAGRIDDDSSVPF